MGHAGRIIASVAILAVTVACGSGDGAVASPSAQPTTPTPALTAMPTSEPTPTPDPAAAVLDACADAPEPTGEPIALELRTKNSEFDLTHLEGPRHCEPFTITLTNDDRVWEHSVDIELMDEDDTVIFTGALVVAPSSRIYEIPALPAGEYRFVCGPHRTAMRGTIVVGP